MLQGSEPAPTPPPGPGTTPDPPSAPEPVPVPIQDFTSGALRESYSTHFDGCGQQACGCGIPPELLKDKQGATIFHVALNGITSSSVFKLATGYCP